MITKIWFQRDCVNNTPAITLIHKEADGSQTAACYVISEELYDQWVPDTNHFPGESLSEGIVYDKPLIPNLKGIQ